MRDRKIIFDIDKKAIHVGRDVSKAEALNAYSAAIAGECITFDHKGYAEILLEKVIEDVKMMINNHYQE